MSRCKCRHPVLGASANRGQLVKACGVINSAHAAIQMKTRSKIKPVIRSYANLVAGAPRFVRRRVNPGKLGLIG